MAGTHCIQRGMHDIAGPESRTELSVLSFEKVEAQVDLALAWMEEIPTKEQHILGHRTAAIDLEEYEQSEESYLKLGTVALERGIYILMLKRHIK